MSRPDEYLLQRQTPDEENSMSEAIAKEVLA